MERPASVVKELIENSLDAGARNISIEIEGAGRKLIRVVDDGRGIPAAELPKVFLRHATSKITSYDDLFRLDTMGFRGEAMAAISSVAEVKVESAEALPSGVRSRGAAISAAYSKISGVSPSPVSAGTTVEVAGLFANTPARLKFLKSAATEKNACVAAALSPAMANHGTAFRLSVDGKNAFRLEAANSDGERLAAALKKDIFGRAVFFEARDGDVAARGWMSPIDAFVPSRSMQWVFANRRPVFSKTVSSAVYEAIREFLPRGRHPVFAIFVDVPPSAIDVNVSPTKREIKFADETSVFKAIRSAVGAALASSGPVSYGFASRRAPAMANTREMSYDASGTSAATESESAAFFASELASSRVKFIADVFGYCLIAADGDGLYLIDSHAASERVLYEKYRSRETASASQLLLAPMVVDIPASVYADVVTNIDKLDDLGWKIEPFGESSLKCSGVPAALGDIDARSVLMAVFEPSRESGSTSLTEEDIIKRSCHAAVRGRDRLGFVEYQRLVNDLFAAENYQTCPHGRPTLVKISSSELASKFRRT